jgi:hypothetical protein
MPGYGSKSGDQHRKAIKVAATGRSKGGLTLAEATKKLAADKKAERHTYRSKKG